MRHAAQMRDTRNCCQPGDDEREDVRERARSSPAPAPPRPGRASLGVLGFDGGEVVGVGQLAAALRRL